ncbi:type VII secretion protein EccB [Streptomyces sp. NPDC091268]|uniref:type VII secretion protein EccB n=1 Tax=Streptomyces sp. NPDC091268 TaxID=3365979 RepID=UPI003805709C
MASRRDELNAYTFAKRRTVAAFLQPSAAGTEEGAPRPLRAIVPGLVAGALLLGAFGAWGMFRPVAPKNWDAPGTRVIVGAQSTTRYVVLRTTVDGRQRTRLHPVLNLASARLVLDPAAFEVVRVQDALLDQGKLPRGPVLGIPYAPDRLPAPEDAGRAKRWAVCQQPGGNGRGVQSAVFVLAAREEGVTDGAHRLADTQALYVQSADGARERYLVDSTGTKYRFPEGAADAGTMTDALVGTGAVPQQVTRAWLATLETGDDLAFPQLPAGGAGGVGADAGVRGLSAGEGRVGMVLRAMTGSGAQHYVVLPGKVVPVSDFVAWLLISSPATDALDMHGAPREVDLQSLHPDPSRFAGTAKWPRKKVERVNQTTPAPVPPAGTAGGRDTVCNVLRAVDARGKPTLSTWAGTGFPVDLTAGGAGAYVTPGSGLLYTQLQGRQTTAGGSLFLVTDTGLRYAVQTDGDGRARPGQAQTRLGYGAVAPAPVPIAWSEFLSKGPRLDTDAARQPQGS